jgi:hypothetical protein
MLCMFVEISNICAPKSYVSLYYKNVRSPCGKPYTLFGQIHFKFLMINIVLIA